jgi:drug/metabolite transporter (DMT)-like permease
VAWQHWRAFAVSSLFGIVLGNLAMIACLRRAGPRRTEVLLSFKGPLVAMMAYLWLGETLQVWDMLGAGVALGGILLAVLFHDPDPGAVDEVSGPIWQVIGLGVLATLLQGVGFLAMKPAMLDGTAPLAATAVRLLGAAFLISLVALWPARAFRRATEVTPRLLFQTVVPGFIGYVVSSTLLLFAIAHYDAGIATVLGSLSPVVVLLILWIKDGRVPTPKAALGACLAITGTAFIALT